MSESQQCQRRKPACPAWHGVVSRALRGLLLGAVGIGSVVFVGGFALAFRAGSAPAEAAVEAHGQGPQTSTAAHPQIAACPVPADPQTLICPLPTREQEER